jgi:hypothetical protein
MRDVLAAVSKHVEGQAYDNDSWLDGYGGRLELGAGAAHSR